MLVTDTNNNPVSGVSVSFAVTAGGGSTTGGSATTDASGIATVGGWTLGTGAGANTLTATATGLAGSPVTFTATGTRRRRHQVPGQLGQLQPAGRRGVNISAQLADTYGNPVATAARATPSMEQVQQRRSLAATYSSTNTSGLATTALRHHDRRHGDTVTGHPLHPERHQRHHHDGRRRGHQDRPDAGNSQSATVATAVTTAPSVLVTDTNGNPVSGVAVTFAVASGGGSVSGGSATTNSSGIATVGGWTLGTGAGANTLTATAAGLSGSPVTFTATGTAGAATKYVVTATTNSPAAGAAVTVSAQLADTYGNPVSTSGSRVTWSKSDGHGSFGDATARPTPAAWPRSLLTTYTVAGTATT